MLDNTIYANDPLAQELLKYQGDYAAKSVDPVQISIAYSMLKPSLLSEDPIQHILIVGDPGTGKSQSVLIAGYQLGIPVMVIPFYSGIRPSQILGNFEPNPNKGVNGDDREFVWKDGPLVICIRRGYIANLEELLQCRPEEVGFLLKLMDSGVILLPNGERVKVHPNFRIVATGNPECYGNHKQNAALINRFYSIIGIDSFTELGFLTLGKARRSYIKNEFFSGFYKLTEAVKDFLRVQSNKGGTCSIRNLWGLFGKLENLDQPLTLALFNEAVNSSCINVLTAAGVPRDIVASFKDDRGTKDLVTALYNQYMASPKPLSGGMQAQPQPQPQPQPQQMAGATMLSELHRRRKP